MGRARTFQVVTMTAPIHHLQSTILKGRSIAVRDARESKDPMLAEIQHRRSEEFSARSRGENASTSRLKANANTRSFPQDDMFGIGYAPPTGMSAPLQAKSGPIAWHGGL